MTQSLLQSKKKYIVNFDIIVFKIESRKKIMQYLRTANGRI